MAVGFEPRFSPGLRNASEDCESAPKKNDNEIGVAAEGGENFSGHFPQTFAIFKTGYVYVHSPICSISGILDIE